MKNLTYSDKLKSPKWQKKRLEIMKRDNFTCKKCGDIETQLHVHHKEYINGLDPWEYLNKYLITLCEDCHCVIENTIKYHKETNQEFNFNDVRVYGFWDKGNKITYYRYKNGDPLIIIKTPESEISYILPKVSISFLIKFLRTK